MCGASPWNGEQMERVIHVRLQNQQPMGERSLVALKSTPQYSIFRPLRPRIASNASTVGAGSSDCGGGFGSLSGSAVGRFGSRHVALQRFLMASLSCDVPRLRSTAAVFRT